MHRLRLCEIFWHNNAACHMLLFMVGGCFVFEGNSVGRFWPVRGGDWMNGCLDTRTLEYPDT